MDQCKSPTEEARDHSSKFRIDISKIGEEIESQAATYNYYGTLHAMAKEAESEKKIELKRTRGWVWIEKKKESLTQKPRPTNEDLKAHVDVDSRVLDAEKELREASRIVNQLDNDKQASWLKGDMLKLMSFEAARHYKSDFK